jgi:hypothetical protein
MRQTTAHNHNRRLANALDHAYLMATYDHPSHRDLCARIAETVWQDPGLKRCPGWVTSALMERRVIRSEEIYQHLLWAFPDSDGVPRQLDDLSDADRQRVFSGEISGAHYWMRTTRSRETLPDGTIRETITRTPTTNTY